MLRLVAMCDILRDYLFLLLSGVLQDCVVFILLLLGRSILISCLLCIVAPADGVVKGLPFFVLGT